MLQAEGNVALFLKTGKYINILQTLALVWQTCLCDGDSVFFP